MDKVQKKIISVNFCHALFSFLSHIKRFGNAGLGLAPLGPATGHLDTGFSWFPWVQEQMLRWFLPFQVASTCISCSPPNLNSVVTNCLLSYYVKWPLPPGDNPTAVNKYYYYFRAVRFGSSDANLRHHIFIHQIYGKNLVLHSHKYGTIIHI
jgi:hypothetical protein